MVPGVGGAVRPEGAVRVYDDLRSKHDADAPTTASVRTPYEPGGLNPGKPGVALPDVAGATAPGSGEPLGRTQARSPGVVEPRITLPDGTSLDLGLERNGMSNAVLVAGKETATGKPLTVFGPQTGYYAPQLLVEQVPHGSRGRWRAGCRSPGTNLVVQLGRGARLRVVGHQLPAATTSTRSSSGSATRRLQADRRVDRLPASARSACRWTSYVHTENTTPNPGTPAPPNDLRVPRPAHPPRHRPEAHDRAGQAGRGGAPALDVRPRGRLGARLRRAQRPGLRQGRRQSSSAPPATSTSRSTGSTPTIATSPTSPRVCCRFARGRSEPDLPRWADKKYDWQGLAALRSTRRGRPTRSPATSSAGTTSRRQASPLPTTTGATARSTARFALEKRLLAGDRRHRRRSTLPGPGRGHVGRRHRGLPGRRHAAWLLAGHRHGRRDQGRRAAVLKAWLADGAPRVDRDRDGAYDDHQAAIALFDTWWEDGKQSVAYDVLKGKLEQHAGACAAAEARRPPAPRARDRPGTASLGTATSTRTCAWRLARRCEGAYRYRYCGDDGKLAACRTTLRDVAGEGRRPRTGGTGGRKGRRDLTYDKTHRPDPVDHRRRGRRPPHRLAEPSRPSSRWWSSSATGEGDLTHLGEIRRRPPLLPCRARSAPYAERHVGL